LIPTPRVLAAAGKRVRLIGFMAHMDLPSGGAFYLTPKPLVCDEAGGGTADLPPEAVRVTVPAARDRQIPFVAGPLEVTGMFALGNQSEPDGRTSSFRLTLDSQTFVHEPARGVNSPGKPPEAIKQ
ncbi:MAG: hypothetical protein ABIS92_16425, partial [Polyangia bacterium]